MRNHKTQLIGAALLLLARTGLAQTPQTAPSPAATAIGPGMTGTLDVGGVGTGTDGDQARFERYRDSRDGLYTSLSLNRLSRSYLFDASATHIGYRDQRYEALFRGSRLNLNFNWTSIPLNFSYLTRTPYVTNGSVLTLDDSAQAAVQGPTTSTTDGTAVGVPCAPGAPPGACGNPTQAAQAKANRSIYDSLATQFDMRHQRDVASIDGTYRATKNVDVDGRFASTSREGEQPWGASFAFNNAIELPQPLDQRTNEASIGASWADPRAMLRVGWDASWFTNQFQSLTWDNPNFLTSYNNGLAPPNGPYDPNGYSNGNGPAQGRMALAPDNSMNVVSATGLYKLARRSTINGTLQLTTQSQDEQLIPWTINPLINTPQVWAAFPHLAALPRNSAEAEARGVNTLINFNSRPYRQLNFTVRYRYNKRDVRTPIFDATEYVRFDAVPEENPEGFSPQFDNSHSSFDANAAYTPARLGTFRLGYGHEGITREGRGFADVGEHVVRASWDALSGQYVSIRASVDNGWRRGSGFVEAASGGEDTDTATGPGGTQPTLRYYDEADRNRLRGSIVVSSAPTTLVDVFLQFNGTRDEYLADESAAVSRPGELFGLQDWSTTSWVFGANLHPREMINVGASYGHDIVSSLQKSRNANPPPDPTWTDPSRDWTLDNDDHINNFNLTLDVLHAITNTDIRFGYDFNDSENSYVHGGPRITSLTQAGQFIPLPNVTNTWHRATVDVQYFFRARTALAVGYYYEKFDVADWNTIDTNGPVTFAPATGTPRIDWLGGLITGYGNRPYNGSTVTARLLYRF